MRRFLTSLSVVVMMCLVCISCKKDEETDPVYPVAVESGLWAGGNGSTGYACDIEFAVGGSTGNFCEIAVTSPDGKKTEQYNGQFTYTREAGLISVKFNDAKDGAPYGALMQYKDAAAKDLEVVIISADQKQIAAYNTYTVSKVTFPGSIAGQWGDTKADNKLSIEFGVYAVSGGAPIKGSITLGAAPAIPFEGKYNYDTATGKVDMTITVAILPGQEIKPTATYDAKTNKINCAIAFGGADYKFELDRMTTGN